jgi:gas vesicle protein
MVHTGHGVIDMNDRHGRSQDQNARVVFALLAGTAIGAGLAMWLAPRAASELRQRVTDTARRVGRQATDAYEQAGSRVGETVDDLTRRGNAVRDDFAGAVAHGAQEVERYAASAMSHAR